MNQKSSLTVVITAYNEALTLRKTVESTPWALKGIIDDYEIIIIDDASLDNSGIIADELAKSNDKIVVIHNPINLNQGGCIKKAIGLATKEYIFITGADDRIEKDSLREIFKSIGQGNTIILTYIANEDRRYPLRLFLSRGFVIALNFLFGLKIRYYNGPTIIKTVLLSELKLTKSNNFALMAEIVTLLLKRGCLYKEVPMILNPDPKGQNLGTIKRNFFGVVRMILSLFWRIQIKHQF